MKKLFFAVFALAALSLLAPSTGFTQTAWNQLGIYADPTGDPASANVSPTIGDQFTGYLVLTNPVNEFFNGGTGTAVPITAVDGFECNIAFPPSASFFTLSTVFAANAIDVGVKPDFVVGFSESAPVTGNAVVLVTWTFLALAPGPHDFFLDITALPSIPGVMAVVDANDPENANLQPVYRSTNDANVPVFSVTGDNAIANETQTFGGVKSLFR
ncbi:MAG: hypothetical protein ACI9UK_002257 [Candidatus Krumholzibacteriia bacterium]|jgi:hypothetical protein